MSPELPGRISLRHERIRVCTRRFAIYAVLGCSEKKQGDPRTVELLFSFSQKRREVGTGEIRHLNVADDELHGGVSDEIERLTSRFQSCDAEPRTLKHHLQEEALVRIVVDQHDVGGASRGHIMVARSRVLFLAIGSRTGHLEHKRACVARQGWICSL
jgi:hypothetical protein